MRIFFTAVLLLSVSLCSYAQPEWPPKGEQGVDFNRKDSNGKKTGTWYRTYSDGGLYYAGEFKNDKPAPGSTLFYFYENGRIMAEHFFRPDSKVVEARNFYKSGKLQSVGNYLNQKKDSLWTFYDEQARLRSTEEYKLDSLDGYRKIYFPTGTLLKEEFFINGTPDGEWAEYYEDGKTRTKGYWKDGKYNGDFTFYHQNGAKEAEGAYVNDNKSGQWMYYLPNGKLEVQILYENGEAVKSKRHNGDVIEYYPSGIPKLECTYKNGELDGIYTEYYDQGEWIREPVNNNEPGLQLEFKEKLINRQPSKECEYVNGKLKGEVLYYNPDGSLQKTEVYENGVLKETIQGD